MKKYVVGKGKIPEWLNKQAEIGRVKFNYAKGILQDVTVHTVAKTYTAMPGDIIELKPYGLCVSKPVEDIIDVDKVENNMEEFIPTDTEGILKDLDF